MRRAIVCAAVPILMSGLAGCAGSINPNLKASGYYDTRELPGATVTVSNVDTKHRNRVFAYADLETESEFPKYVEATFTQQVAKGFGGLAEFDRNFNAPPGFFRFGATYQLPMPDAWKRQRITFKYTPLSTHERGQQWSFAGALLFGRDYVVDGYFDYNVRSDYVSTDWQIGRRIQGNVYGVAEFRHNGLRSDPTGVGFGVEWRIR
jgi:hypothetical protein